MLRTGTATGRFSSVQCSEVDSGRYRHCNQRSLHAKRQCTDGPCTNRIHACKRTAETTLYCYEHGGTLLPLAICDSTEQPELAGSGGCRDFRSGSRAGWLNAAHACARQGGPIRSRVPGWKEGNDLEHTALRFQLAALVRHFEESPDGNYDEGVRVV